MSAIPDATISIAEESDGSTAPSPLRSPESSLADVAKSSKPLETTSTSSASTGSPQAPSPLTSPVTDTIYVSIMSPALFLTTILASVEYEP